MLSSGDFFLAAPVFQAVSVQVDHREAQIVISPNQLAIFDTKGGEHRRIEIGSKIGMAGAGPAILILALSPTTC
jgi:hypothetical protein